MDRPLPWLRYVDAGDLDDTSVDLDGMNVESPTGEHLGSVNGFIVDAESARPYYVVVDSGGWFKSKHYLVPIGHVRLEANREVFVADLTRDRIEKFPGFDKDEFATISEAELRRFNDTTLLACDIGYVPSPAEPFANAWNRPDYRQPDWWRATPSHLDRMGGPSVTTGAAPGAPAAGEPIRERIHARDRDTAQPSRQADPSPHFDGRAQPGDVIGVETGGERTYVGDTAEDENERRREAEEANRKRKD